MVRPVSGVISAIALAAVLTLVMAWPVVVAPTEQVFGHEIVGRHHDPFTVMWQMAGDGPAGPYRQPVTDGLGWLFARVLDPVAAYNVLVLLSFPLTAGATYGLARYLRIPHGPALVAGLLHAFAPVHLAHAAYHPHIAQTHWLPLYLLALFAMIDRPSVWRASGVVAAGAMLTLANFYAGFAGAVLSPAALLLYWWGSPRAPLPLRSLVLTTGLLASIAAVGLATVVLVYPQVFEAQSGYGFSVDEVARYRARWWAYLVPAADHPLVGPFSGRLADSQGAAIALLELQVFLGYALIVLSAVALGGVAVGTSDPARRRIVLALSGLALTAWGISLGPLSGACTPGSWAPACRLHEVAPMFRAYARFALPVHLTLALVAAMGVWGLMGRGRPARMLVGGLLVLATVEYAPWPPRARDVLPTQGHRWLAVRFPDQRTLECSAHHPATMLVPWLMQRQVGYLDDAVPTCQDPRIGERLAALGYTHLLVQPGEAAEHMWNTTGSPGLTRLASFEDAVVYAVSPVVPEVVDIGASGFFDYEHSSNGWWRWMGRSGQLRVRNTTLDTHTVQLEVTIGSAGWPRSLQVSLDDGPAVTQQVDTERATYVFGPWTLTPGDHSITFVAFGDPYRPADHHASADTRELTLAVGAGNWKPWEDVTR